MVFRQWVGGEKVGRVLSSVGLFHRANNQVRKLLNKKDFVEETGTYHV